MEVQAILDAVVSHAMVTGQFEQVNEYEPKSAPGNGLTCAVWIQSIEPVRSSGLNSTSVKLEMNVRAYTSMMAEPASAVDPNLTMAVDALMAAYTGDFTLDGMIRNVDLLGQHGPGLRADAGYVLIGEKMMRIFTIILPLIINDVWEQTP